MPSIGISDTTLRDSYQALRTTRFSGEEVLPLAEKIDPVGFEAAEVWGGATFDVCLRFLREDPWKRLENFRRSISRTPLRMLLRGHYLLGYRPQPLDLQEAFIKTAVAKGISEIRVFDALNDPENLAEPIRFAKEAGARVQGALVYTESPYHSEEGFCATAKDLTDLGADAIALTDVAGILSPAHARRLIEGIRAATGKPVHLHARSVTGMAAMTYLAAAEAGAAGLDCPVAPFALSGAQPATETMVAALEDMGISTGIDREALKRLSKASERVAIRHIQGRADRALYEMTVVVHKLSSGMVSNIVTQLSAHGALDRLEEILNEVIRVRIEFGWPPLVTPVSQMVATQAVFNVLLGERYGRVPRDTVEYFKGYYGRPPGPVDESVAERVLKGQPRASGRAGALLPPALPAARARLEKEGLLEREEDLLTYALFPRNALEFFQYRKNPGAFAARSPGGEIPETQLLLDRFHSILRKHRLSHLEVEEGGRRISVSRPTVVATVPVGAAVAVPDSPTVAATSAVPEGDPVPTPLGGVFYRSPTPEAPSFVEVGDVVGPETVIGLVETMKLFNEITAGSSGRVTSVVATNGQMLKAGDPILFITPA